MFLSIQIVQKLAGHSSIETTQEFYLSLQQTDSSIAREVQSKLIASLVNLCLKIVNLLFFLLKNPADCIKIVFL